VLTTVDFYFGSEKKEMGIKKQSCVGLIKEFECMSLFELDFWRLE
jgi:hypothetical protein